MVYAFASQRNFRIHVFTGVVVFALGLWLQLSVDRLAVLVLTVAAVLVLELLNTATEAVVDLSVPAVSPLGPSLPKTAPRRRCWWRHSRR